MPTLIPPSVGAPGDTISASELQTAIDAFEGNIGSDPDNFRINAVQCRHLITSEINRDVGSAENFDDTLFPYSGTTEQNITHGTVPLLVAPGVLQAGASIIFYWHVFATHILVEVPEVDPPISDAAMDVFTSFKMKWDIGAGLVSVPGSMFWAVSKWTKSAIGYANQGDSHNISGSWMYTNDTGSTITISAVRVTVIPSNTYLTGVVELGEGNLIYVKLRE